MNAAILHNVDVTAIKVFEWANGRHKELQNTSIGFKHKLLN